MAEGQQRFFAMFARAAASPSMARALIETVMQIDVRDVLPSVEVPALVLHVEATERCRWRPPSSWPKGSLGRASSRSPA